MDPTAMNKYYGPSLPHLTTLPLLTHVKEEDEELQKDLDEEMLHENVEEMINLIIQEVFHKDDTFDEDPIDMPNEAQRVVQDSLVWPRDDLNPVTNRTTDFESLTKGQCQTDTMVDLYLKYQERKHHYIKGLYFFNSFFFRKLVITFKEDVANGFKKIALWFKDINIFKCDYIFLPILLRYSIYVL